MKKTDLAYAAGILDGEGCIRLAPNYHSRPGREVFSLLVTVGSTDEWLCQYLRMSFGGTVYRMKTRSSSHAPCWVWRVVSRQAYEMLRLTLPYLHLKRPQAEIALAFQKAKTQRGRKPYRTAEEVAIEEAQAILISQMKKKPKQPA